MPSSWISYKARRWAWASWQSALTCPSRERRPSPQYGSCPAAQPDSARPACPFPTQSRNQVNNSIVSWAREDKKAVLRVQGSKRHRILDSDPQHWIDKEFKYFLSKKLLPGTMLSDIWSRIFFHPGSGSWGPKSHRIPDPQQWKKTKVPQSLQINFKFIPKFYILMVSYPYRIKSSLIVQWYPGMPST